MQDGENLEGGYLNSGSGISVFALHFQKVKALTSAFYPLKGEIVNFREIHRNFSTSPTHRGGVNENDEAYA